MGRYSRSYVKQQSKSKPWKIHPIWRGIGFVLMVLLPIMSLAGAILLVRENFRQGWVNFPGWMLESFVLPSIGRVFVADLLLTLVLLVIGSGVLTLGYGFVYRLVGPPRYGEYDVPPLKRRKKPR
jgi:hypothetical protein